MPTCAIIGCTSGYRSNREKCHLFSVPRDKESQERWEKAIQPFGSGINPKRSVCEKHFYPAEIMWERKHLASDGTVLGVVTLEKFIDTLQSSATTQRLRTVYISLDRSNSTRGSFVAGNPGRSHCDCSLRRRRYNGKTTTELEEGSLRAPEGTVARSPLSELMPEQDCRVERIMETEITDAASQDPDRGSPTASIPSPTLRRSIASEISMTRHWNRENNNSRKYALGSVFSHEMCQEQRQIDYSRTERSNSQSQRVVSHKCLGKTSGGKGSKNGAWPDMWTKKTFDATIRRSAQRGGLGVSTQLPNDYETIISSINTRSTNNCAQDTRRN